jgi:adenosylmethionine-8-amino-7-oxononanoate aminotransferase
VAPPGLSRCFYADNGSSAVEVAVKMSFHYWRNVGQTKKRGFITLANSYHGETLGALAVGDVELYKAIYKPLLMDVRVVGSPDCYARGPGLTCAEHSASQFALMEEALALHHEETAAVIVEPATATVCTSSRMRLQSALAAPELYLHVSRRGSVRTFYVCRRD